MRVEDDIVISIVASGTGLSLIRTASAGYGSDNNDNGSHKSKAERRKEERKRNKKKNSKKNSKKVSQATVQKKVAEFSAFNAPQHQAAYRTVSSIKKANPAKFRAIENVFKKYNTVSGKLRVQPNSQTLSAINMYKSYKGYASYLNYTNKLKK